MKDWKDQIEERVANGSISHFALPSPPVPPIPPIPPVHGNLMSTGRANVVASRLGDEDLRLIDMLMEAGIFNTRSEAVAYLVSEGIKARRDTFEKVSKSLEEIRKTRKEAENQIEKLRQEIGFKELREKTKTDETDRPNRIGEASLRERACPKCRKNLSDSNARFCPSCGTRLEEE
jgi:Arc/MetJ-type ribon-helix-helix transcriptional regulator